MTAKELLQFEMEQVRKQIDVCLEGLSEAGYATKCSPTGMTPAEVVEHLCDAYEAYLMHCRGEKYDFGSFVIEPKTLSGREIRLWQLCD
jgi:hypothetical protein